MALPIESSALSDMLVILGAAGLVIPAFHSLRLSPVIGFILVGVLVGPHGLGGFVDRYPWLSLVTITHREAVDAMAEVGIVLLMFVIGLELSFDRLRTMRRLVFGLGTLQVAATTIVLSVGLSLLGQSPITALVIGFALALSSTAIVLPILSAEHAIVAGTGRASFAILLFQDLALIPALFLLSTLRAGGDELGPATVAAVAAKGVVAVAILVLVGRLALRPALRRAARTRSPELFMAASLLIVLGASVITAVAGLSLVIGALLAGLLVADTEYRRQVEVTVEPFKGLLLGVFLISIGMELDLAQFSQGPLTILAGVAGLVAIKALVAWPLIARFAGRRGAARAALLLGPSSEMTFILLAAAAATGLIAVPALARAKIVTALAMTMIPLLSWLGQMVEEHRRRSAPVADNLPPPPTDAQRVVVIGFGRVGQLVADMLETHGIPYIAIDTDADAVAQFRAAGRPVHYGDAANIDLLHRLDLGQARALVITMDDPATTERVVQAARGDHPNLQIIARARDARHAAGLYRVGVSDAVPETVEASLQLSEAVLVDIGVPMGPVIASIHEKRAALRTQIQALVPDLTRPPALGRRRLRDGPRPARQGGNDG